MSYARKNTNKLLEMIESGVVTKDHVITCCLKYMSEDDVTDMMECNELLENNDIIIEDWTGEVLFEGDYNDSEVDDVLDANRCPEVTCQREGEETTCSDCDDTGYVGEFEVKWSDESRDDNVYEYINY